MKKPLVSLTLLIALIAGLSSIASADATVLFGPQNFIRKAGAPETQSVTINIPAEARNLYLWVKASSKENQQIKNVSVALNGSELVNQDQLQQQNPQYLPISAAGSATLDVTLKGKPGDAVSIYLVGELDRNNQPRPRR